MLKVFYTAGPGNAFDIFRRWTTGERDLTTSHVSYSGQMLAACARHGAALLMTCTHEGGVDLSHGDMAIRQRPDLSRGTSGLAFHRSFRAKAEQNMRDAVAFGADVMIISEDTNPAHYARLRRRGMRVVQALHTCLWHENRHPSLMQRLRLRGYARGYRAGDMAVLSASDTVSSQIAALAGDRMPAVLEFLPLYLPEHYADLPPPALATGRLEVLFVSRIEANKGATDLIEIAARLRALGVAVRFQICGTGGELAHMQAMVAAQGLQDEFLFHGWCDRDRLRQVMADCAVSIIPTRAELSEGFNQVIVESVLAGRPAIAADTCPAVRYVGDAAISIPAGDLAAYVGTLADLAANPARLARLAQACPAGGRRFLDPSQSFGHALDEIFTACHDKRPFRSIRIDPAMP